MTGTVALAMVIGDWSRPNRPIIDYIKHFWLSRLLLYESMNESWSMFLCCDQINTIDYFSGVPTRLYSNALFFLSFFYI